MRDCRRTQVKLAGNLGTGDGAALAHIIQNGRAVNASEKTRRNSAFTQSKSLSLNNSKAGLLMLIALELLITSLPDS
jgi:hypothetical protein